MIVLELMARPKSGEGVKSGPIGLAVILLLCIAAYFLFKSMSKHLKRVREDFPQDDRRDPAAPPPASDLSASDRPAAPPPSPPRGPASTPGGDGSP